MAECDRPGKHRNPKHRKRAARAKARDRRLAKHRERQASLRLEQEILDDALSALLDEMAAWDAEYESWRQSEDYLIHLADEYDDRVREAL